MNKQTITFTASEQTLTKTGGIEHYASNIVSYIEASFTLGDNWSGYDSIRAVWFNDYKTISAVLDSDGVCIVPHEVLTSRGKVMVNLVGSVLVSDELKDRLTTFPCEALKVSAKAKISGSETAAVTPSQFEQFVSIVISEVEKVTGMTAQAETLPAGSQATARYEDGILYLGIPQGIRGERGETGADGADGNGIASVVYNADYSLTLIFDNGERFTTPPIRGERGPAGADGRDGTDGADGVTPNISIGNVETLDPSQDAYVTRRGTDANPIFDFGIPKGDKGDDGTVPDLDLILPTDTASGDIASITDGQNVVPVKSLKVTLEPIQDLHGYDKPWSGGNGKNKLQVTAETQTISGVTFTVHDDGTVTVNGTATDTAVFSVNANMVAEWSNYAQGDYVLNGSPTNQDTSKYKLRVFYASNDYIDAGSGVTWTFRGTSGVTVFKTDIVVYSGTTMSNVLFKPMIRLASETDSSFAPYSNICPISGHTECVTEVCGVNVWDEEWESGVYDVNSYSKVANANRIRCKTPIRVLPNTSYYVHVGSNVPLRVIEYDSNMNILTYDFRRNSTFTTTANTQFITIHTGENTYGTTYNHDISINYPSTDHDYHAYDGTQYTTTLGRTVYGGTLDVVSGELTIGRVFETVDGARITRVSKDGDVWRVTPNPNLTPSGRGYTDGISNIYPWSTSWGGISGMTIGVAVNTSQGGEFLIRDDSLTSLTDFRTRFNETPLQLCYELATPQTYQLTPQTISLLHGNNNVWSDGSVVMVYNADVGLYIDKKLGTSGTRTLSMTRTLDTKSDDTDDTKSDAELTKSDNIQLAGD